MSTVAGCVTLFVSIIVIIVSKPRMVMKVRDNHEHGLDWFRVVMLSIILGLVVSIIIIILKTHNHIEITKEEPRKKITTNY